MSDRPQRTLWDFHITVHGRWWRTAAFYGEAPGSHTGSGKHAPTAACAAGTAGSAVSFAA